MTWVEILIVALVALWLAGTVIFLLRQRGTECSGCCADCCGHCRKGTQHPRNHKNSSADD